MHDARGARGQLAVVRREQQDTTVCGALEQRVGNAGGTVGIKVVRGLVGNDDGRVQEQGARPMLSW